MNSIKHFILNDQRHMCNKAELKIAKMIDIYFNILIKSLFVPKKDNNICQHLFVM